MGFQTIKSDYKYVDLDLYLQSCHATATMFSPHILILEDHVINAAWT